MDVWSAFTNALGLQFLVTTTPRIGYSFKDPERRSQEFINETHFKRFLMIIRSAGYVDSSMIGSVNALNFAYVLYLKLKRDLGNNPNIESWVRRWFVMSLLTGRYSGSPESRFDKDIKAVPNRPFADVLAEVKRPNCPTPSGISAYLSR